MQIKLVLMTATALSVLMSAAYAQNVNYLSQTGNYNNASVNQVVGEGNNVGTALKPATQSGLNNDLDVVQQNASSLGVPTGSFTGGVAQAGSRNVLNVSQQNSITHQVLQNGGLTATAATNTLSITQTQFAGFSPTYRANALNSVIQTYTGAVGGSDRNQATISQHRATTGANASHGQTIGTVTQNGTSHQLTASQDGARNQISTITQTGGSANRADISQVGYWNSTGQVTQNGSSNQASLSITGDRNGGLLSADFPYGIDARPYAGFGHPSNNASIRQVGIDNRTSLTIDGFDNGYAIYQDGDSNRANALEIFGSDNQLAVGQYFGNLNTISLAAIVGDENLVALRQGSRPTGSGDNNKITGSVTGSDNFAIADQVGSDNKTTFGQAGGDNQLWILAVGDDNVLNADQSGGNNDATVNVTGSVNEINIRQEQTGAATNTVLVAVTGSNNNTALAFSGDALAARALARIDLGDVSFGRSDLVQVGTNNSLDLSVLTSINSFATAQQGDSNAIEHDILGGNGNQAVIAQFGNLNTSVTVQDGSNNNLGVIQ